MRNRISFAVFLLLAHLSSWAQIGGDYNPNNPSDPGNPTQEYTLTLKASPSNGGSFNTTSTNIAGGKTYNLRAYPNTDFAFVAWICNGDTLSKSSSYTYTMPYHDVEITGAFIYSPSNPSDPQEQAQKYTLTLKATPTEGGSFNTSSSRVSVGERYNLRAYPNTDFAFVAWLCEGDTLSKVASYDYTMPSHNVDITGVFTYRPSSPSDPQEQSLKYQLSLVAEPMNSGSFNISNERLAVGSNNSLRAYSNTDFVFRRWTMGDSVLSTNPNMDFVMPSHNVQIVGHFEYNPASPANPNANYWNKLTGEVIVDDFTAGYLSSAISTVISGSSSNDVQMITVSGKINSNDFGIANNYKNCTLLDLSRVSGVAEVPSYAFDYTNLETVYLPSTIEKIGYRAFADCTKLSSITVYAMTPPTLESGVFQSVPEGLVVYVPAASIAQYQDDETWGKFTLLPIQEDIRSISISLPEGTNIQDYSQMWLELTNTKSGQRMHYVMTDRNLYTFANIIRNTSWNVTLRNERGDVFGQIDNVEVKDEDISVTFASLSKPQSVSLAVVSSDGQDVTSQTQITWTDAQGNYVAQGASLSGLPVGYQLNYRLVLSQELAMQFDTPAAAEYTLTDGNNALTCQLQAIKKLTISGKVKDASTGLPLSGTFISASQTFGGKYSKTLYAKTDNNGVFSMEVFNVPTSVAIAATDYVSQTLDYSNNEFSGLTELAVPDVSLKSITGATISVNFIYTNVEGEKQNWYSDYHNVNYTLYNLTSEKNISQFNVQYPQIVLLEEVEDGDMLRLTATSRTSAFKAVEVTATIAGQRAEATFAITELGHIEASFSKTGNSSVVGSLYDASGKLVKTYNYSEAKLTISDLADGNYTLVSMGSSRLFNTIYDLAQLPQTGLADGTDYVQNVVVVKSGAISQISIDEVPTLDESKLYYTGDNTSFTVNKPSIVVGNYLTLTGRIDFKAAYATNVSNVQMIVDLPESCQFVENSVMVGNSTSSYTLNGNRITIPMMRYTDRVRFCIIPTLGGEYAPSAFVQFDLNGETVTQPIGSANYTAKDLSISVPSTVAKTSVPVSGTAIGTSNIEIFDNGVLIGQTTSLANGTWATTCDLIEPFNLSYHSIYAKVKTKQNLELQSETVECMYDMNAIQVSKVTMYHWNPEMHTMFESVFDFQNPSTKPNQWTVYYPNKKFTYTVDFTNNSPERVSNILLNIHTADGQIVPLYPTYDKQKDIWVANIDMGSSSNGYYPVNVSVDFDCNVELDSISTLSLFDNVVNTKSNKDIDLTNIQFEGNDYKAEYIYGESRIILYGRFTTTNSIPSDMELLEDTVFSNCIIFSNCNYETNKISLYIPKLTLSYFAEQQDTLSQHFYNWANTLCSKKYLLLEMTVQEVYYTNSPLTRRAAGIIGHTFYAVMTRRRFYSMSRDAQEHFSQLEKLWGRLDRLGDCMPSDIKEQIRDRINELFEQYFNIKTTATFAQSSRMNPLSPLYAISYAGGWLNFASEVGFSIRRKQISNFIAGYENTCFPPPPPRGGNPTGGAAPIGNGQPDDNVRIDPSGFVYEGVAANRIEGVTATIYYKEDVEDMYGDLHENIVKWNAEEFAQENPLFTDENGYYRWDVPQGLWQVKFEKEGYETTYSEWLPVPPPQLDINIAMKQNVQPNVKLAHAYEDAVEVEFDKYMLPELLTTDNIIVIQGNEAVDGSVELLNNEASYEGSSETFASKIRFNAAQPFTEQEITLMVSDHVKSYAGIRMQDDFSQTFTIEPELRSIDCDSSAVVGYGEGAIFTISVLPATASAGKTLLVKTSSPMILSTDAERIILDENGKAQVHVNGELPGMAALTFAVDGYDLSATTLVHVNIIKHQICDMPVSSIASGSEVEKGTKVFLTCATEGAIIYYTLDGSCPCDNTASRMVYDGTPIIINGNITIKTMAVAPGMDESEVAVFTFIVDGIEEVVVNDQIQVYPLPMRNKLNVTANGKTIKSVSITAMNGLQVASSTQVATKVTIDVNTISNGIYIIHVKTTDGTYSRKVLKVE
ncbi:MAG: chitobiase/beta-hexosaminidase C-terminal domain-containing protein [Prevotella sp.]|nr:chitobiase/beta-hexosaminidase C-terminal domain-containing protein [Prevotella sp.]